LKLGLEKDLGSGVVLCLKDHTELSLAHCSDELQLEGIREQVSLHDSLVAEQDIEDFLAGLVVYLHGASILLLGLLLLLTLADNVGDLGLHCLAVALGRVSDHELCLGRGL